MVRSLAGVVKDIADLLRDSGLEEEGNRFDRLRAWASSAETASERREVAVTVLGFFRGMGSFNDLVIMKDGAVDQAASTRLDALRRQLFESAKQDILRGAGAGIP